MPPLTASIDFSSPTSFARSAPLLARARSELQLANVCGGLLMMESAFSFHPIVQRAMATTDHEGGYFFDLDVMAPSGATAKANDVLLALYDASSKSKKGKLDAAAFQEPSWRDKKLAADFSSIDEESIEAAEQAFRAVFDYMLDHAHAFFYQHVLSAAFTPADAPSMARMIQLDAAAALIERSRIAPSALDGPPGPARPRI